MPLAQPDEDIYITSVNAVGHGLMVQMLFSTLPDGRRSGFTLRPPAEIRHHQRPALPHVT